MAEAFSDQRRIESETIRKVGIRLVPFLVVCYFIAYVDRVNVGFAALTMNKDLGLSATAFGTGAALFCRLRHLLKSRVISRFQRVPGSWR
jgi:sugar phosphate permease